MGEEAIGRKILDAAMKVPSAIGSGLLESAYEACLAHELRKEGLPLALPIVYGGEQLDAGYRLDLWIERKVIVEVKSMDRLGGSPAPHLPFARLEQIMFAASEDNVLRHFPLVREEICIPSAFS